MIKNIKGESLSMGMKRIILEISSDSIERVDKMKDALGLTTRAAVLRHALALLDSTIEYTSQNYKLQFKKGDEVATVIIPALG